MAFFARVKDHSDTSTGFSSSGEVFVFSSEPERDEFIKSMSGDGRSVTAIDDAKARSLVTPDPDGKRMFKTPHGGFIAFQESPERREREVHEIEHEYGGKTYKATYLVEDAKVTVESAHGTQSGEEHEGPAQTLAHIIFEVILTEAESAGKFQARGRSPPQRPDEQAVV